MNEQETLSAVEAEKKCRRLIVDYGSTDKLGIDVPYMRLRGRWLQDAGFVIGRPVKIGVRDR
jgi:Toxin SymE, type I toxin-antitoxin system